MEQAPARAAAPLAGPAEPEESDREGDDDGLPETAPLAQRIGRLTAIVEAAAAGEAAPEIAPSPFRAERQALALQRAERARLAARDLPPDEPWDVLGARERAEYAPDAGEPPWRGAG